MSTSFDPSILGVCYPEQWGEHVDGAAIVRRFCADTGARGLFHAKVFGRAPEARRQAEALAPVMRAADDCGMTTMLRWVPESRVALMAELDTFHAGGFYAEALAAVAEPVAPVGILALGNARPGDGDMYALSSLQDAVSAEMWTTSLARRLGVRDRLYPLLRGGDLDPANTRALANFAPPTGAHFYGRQGWGPEHVAPTRNWAGISILDEAGWWFPGSDWGADDWPDELVSAEVGAYWLALLEEASRVRLRVSLYSLAAMFRRDGSTTPAYEVLVGRRPRPRKRLRAPRLKAGRNWLRLALVR